MILLGLGLVPLPAVTLVFRGVGEDFVSELVADGSEELEAADTGFTTGFCVGFEAYGGAEDFGAEGFGADGFGVDAGAIFS